MVADSVSKGAQISLQAGASERCCQKLQNRAALWNITQRGRVGRILHLHELRLVEKKKQQHI
jgi:hypothetical protein